MTAQLPALAVCGSGLDGSASFSAAVATSAGIAVAKSPPGLRGDLAVLTRQVLQAAGIAAHDLRSIRVDRGPGSYIGLRVAVTFARCLAAFAGAELLAIDSLAATARAAVTATPGLGQRRLCPALDGRQGRVQIGAFPWRDGTLAVAAAPRLLADGELAAFLQRGDLVLANDAVGDRLRAVAAAADAEIRPLPVWSADTLFADGLGATATAPTAIEPLYLAGAYVA